MFSWWSYTRHLLLHLHTLALETFCIHLVSRSSLSRPTTLVLPPGLLEQAHSVEILNSHQLFLEVVREELIEGTESKDAFLLQLPHQDLFHLFVCQLAVVVQPHSPNSTLIVLIQFQLMLDHINTSLEDTLIFDSLFDLDLSSFLFLLLI